MDWIPDDDSSGMSFEGAPATASQRRQLRELGFERYDDPELTSAFAKRKLREFGIADESSKPDTLEDGAEPATPKQRSFLKTLGVDRYDDPDLTKFVASQFIGNRLSIICRRYHTDDRNRALQLYAIDRARERLN